QECREARTGDQLPRRGGMPLADPGERVGEAAVTALRERRETEERIGGAAHGRDHDAERTPRQLRDDVGDATKARRVSQAAAAELVNGPQLGLHLLPLLGRKAGTHNYRKAGRRHFRVKSRGNGVACRDRNYDQSVKSRMLYL